ncbi:hypothetical protein PM3016_3611 [Paenibacillus mucilaginosus 3016]|uniref:Uncharacterized protein n=1 Tax=Paenibacillus mucilaginosus 3016 TaxID=1116391 RepID=H6NMU5_9BACL|nr:hypothetical protein PM3016_3611 [Paenibacillus mucilaginosus 3016]
MELLLRPNLLFSNDPSMTQQEYACNIRYIHGFNRLLKRDKIPHSYVVESLRYIERGLESYLQEYYRDKSFVFTVRADILIPAFTVSVVSYHGGEPLLLPESVEFHELVQGYREKACFQGIPLPGRDTGEWAREGPEVEKPLPMAGYIRLLHT